MLLVLVLVLVLVLAPWASPLGEVLTGFSFIMLLPDNMGRGIGFLDARGTF